MQAVCGKPYTKKPFKPRAWLCHTPYTWFEIPYGCINFSLISLYIEMQEKVIQNYALYCVGWVDKPNISDGLRACWVFNPTSPLCHFFMHSTIYFDFARLFLKIGR